METINAKITAALLWAKLVLTEGRYEQWEKLFQAKLEKESGVQWQSEGWDESDQHYLLTLSYPATRTSVVLRFGTTMNGNYDFVDALIQAPGVKQQRAATAKGISSKVPNVDNGDQLIAALVKDLNQRGLLAKKVAASQLQAAIELTAASAKTPEAVVAFMEAASKRLKGGKVTRPVIREEGESMLIGFPLGNAQIESAWRKQGNKLVLTKLAINGGSMRKYIRLDAERAGTQAQFCKLIADTLASAKWYSAGGSSEVLTFD